MFSNRCSHWEPPKAIDQYQFENSKKFLEDRQPSGENMLMEQIFYQDRGHEQVLLVSQDKFLLGIKIGLYKNPIFSRTTMVANGDQRS